MLALYHRSQVEWALWRFKAGAAGRRIPPPEFVSSVRRWLSLQTEKAEVAASNGRHSVFSPLATLMVWLAVELEESGLREPQINDILDSLKMQVVQSLTSSSCSDATVMLSVPAYCPYRSADPDFKIEAHVIPVEALSSLVRKSRAQRIVVLPLQRAAEELSNFLSDAPRVKPGPLAKLS